MLLTCKTSVSALQPRRPSKHHSHSLTSSVVSGRLALNCCGGSSSENSNNTSSINNNNNNNNNNKVLVVGGVEVGRQKHIPVSKSKLLQAITSSIFPDDLHDFLLLSSCLDSILHAEHKCILEEMRVDYDLTHSVHNEPSNLQDPVISEFPWSISDALLENLSDRYTKGFSPKSLKKNSLEEPRISVATRFQKAFMQLLDNAKFEELSAADLMLTSSLNTDYLLTLPINIDWEKASELKAIIFRRGYTTEKQKGLLLVEKLDYLQSEFLLGLFFNLSKPLGTVGAWVSEALQSAIKGKYTALWMKRFKLWLKEMSLFLGTYSYEEHISDDMLGFDHSSEKVLPIWLAAQKAVARYEGVLSSGGPRGKLIRKLLTWTGIIQSPPRNVLGLNSDSTSSEPYLRPIFLPRISLRDIWEPATRKSCGNDLLKMLKNGFSILFSKSILQEPAFEELILLYTEELGNGITKDEDEDPVLQLKIYERIPIPDLPVIFPHKKLSFRILDVVRLDAATILGLLAYFVNYKFEDILSSPSAVVLDVIAVSALIISVTRIALGYKQTWDRYQLLVNRTLYEKTVASGFGSVHFLLDASEQQQYKEAILAYAMLLKMENGQASSATFLGDKCERFLYKAFNEKVQMPIDTAVNTLVRLGLARETVVAGEIGVQAIPCLEAREILKQRWGSLL